MNLLTVRSDRSQVAHDIHTMIHPSVGSTASVCLFKWEDEVLLSFVGYGLKCVLSDWFSINDDAGELFDRLHIGNMSVDRGYDYFIDMVYTLARSYYFLPKDQSIYELIPINMVSLQLNEELDRDDINSIVEQERTKPQREYGYDYVEYDDSPVQSANLDSELDSLLLEISDTDFEEDNPFGEEVETEDDDDFDEDYDSDEHDEYEFEDMPDVTEHIFYCTTCGDEYVFLQDYDKAISYYERTDTFENWSDLTDEELQKWLQLLEKEENVVFKD